MSILKLTFENRFLPLSTNGYREIMAAVTPISSRQVPLDCHCCKRPFLYNIAELKAGGTIICPNCRINFPCRSKELFTAFKHIDRMSG